MTLLVAGLILFLGIHSIRIFAENGRTALVSKLGANGYKGLYTVVAIVGLVLIFIGYGQARMTPSMVWNPPVAMRHIAALLTLIAFVLLTAAYIPRNRIKRAVAFAHLLANGNIADFVLFGSFLIWAVLDFRAARRRDKAAGYVRPPEVSALADLITLVVGVGGWLVFAMWLHVMLIGIKPF